jgi:Rrf2 family cysteine metabolism transcriptional repressor
MRISTAGRYGLRVMLDLALHTDQGPALRHEIGRRQEISPEYIAQLFRRLARAGLAKSVMGPGGGYLLGRPPEQIRIGDILRAVEGPIAPVYCVLPEGHTACKRVSFCATHVLWVYFGRAIENFLDSMTLEDLCQVARQLDEWGEVNCQEAVESFLAPVARLSPAEEGCSWGDSNSGLALAESLRPAPEYSI